MRAEVLAALGVAAGVALVVYSRRNEQTSGGGVGVLSGGFEYVGAVVEGLKLKMDTAFDSVRWANLGKAPDAYRAHKNVIALFHVIRSRESHVSAAYAYQMMCGKRGAAFFSFADHPRPRLPSPCTRGASGAYQITIATWDEVRKVTPLITDFSPLNQDRAALQLIAYRGALNNILRGELRTALSKLKKEWTSLPGGAEELQSYAAARAVYLQYGGQLAPGH